MKVVDILGLSEEQRGWLGKFNSGNPYIDRFLQGSEAWDESIAKTFVWLNEQDENIIGYYSLSAGSLCEMEDDWLYDLGGAAYIKCFAIDRQYQRHNSAVRMQDVEINYSHLLLRDCIKRVRSIREKSLGLSFITLHATQEGEKLYIAHGFDTLLPDMVLATDREALQCKPMYMDLDEE